MSAPARSRFFTNAFATTSQGIDVVSIWTPLALRGNTVISAVFNHTATEVTDNDKGLLDGRRIAEYAYALPRTRWNVGLTQRLGRASLLGRLSYYSGWYDYDSGYGTVFDPSGGLEQGFFDGRVQKRRQGRRRDAESGKELVDSRRDRYRTRDVRGNGRSAARDDLADRCIGDRARERQL